MRPLQILALVIGLITQLPAYAQTQIDDTWEGVWQGTLNISPNTAMDVQFIFKAATDGSLLVMVNSPGNSALNNISADSVAIENDSVSLEFTSLSGSFEGQLKDQTLSGEWTQLETSFPLILVPLEEKEVEETVASEPFTGDSRSALLGTWSGKLFIPRAQMEHPVSVRFEESENGELIGFVLNPDPNGPEQPLADFLLDGSNISFVAGEPRYEGVLTSETTIEGKLIRPRGPELPLNITKNE